MAATPPPATPAPPPAATIAGTAAPAPPTTDIDPTASAPPTTPDTTAPTTPPPPVPTTSPPPPDPTTSTGAPAQPVGALAGQWSVVNDELLHIDLIVNELTGESGRIVFSAPMSFTSVSGATCASTECSFAGVSAPAVISIAADTDVTAITIQLFDATGSIDDTANAG